MMKVTHTRLIAPLLAGLLLLGQMSAQAETANLTHDDFGNITQRTVNPGTAGQATTTYTYDALNRLNTETGPAKIQTLTYDADGNRLSDGSGNYTYDPNSNKMLTTRQGASVITDPSGRITSDGTGRTYTYNQAGQLYTISKNSVLMATYYYNAQSQRTRKVTTASAPQGAQTVVYHYDQQGHLLAETSGTGTAIRTYVWRDDTPIAQIEHQPTRKTLYYEVDHLNTPRAAMDENGKVLWRWESDAFGSAAANEDADNDSVKTTVNLRFPGQYFDAESGLNYNYARNYDSSTGRYTTSDPIGLAGGINTFAYVEGSPINHTDPSGLFLLNPVTIGAAIGGVAGAVQAANSGGGWTQSNTGNILIGAFAGAIAGAVPGRIAATIGVKATIAVGAAAAGLGNVANQATGECINWPQVGVQSVIGGLSGGIGYSAAFSSARSIVRLGGSAQGAGTFGNIYGAISGGAAQIIANLPIPTNLGGFMPSNQCGCSN